MFEMGKEAYVMQLSLFWHPQAQVGHETIVEL